MKKAFSLIELMVVVAIIGILAGVLLASFGGGTASARAARCLSNMKNLANAAQTYGMMAHYYPVAGNIVRMQIKDARAGVRPEKVYDEIPGWISANSQGMFPAKGSSSQPQSVSMYSDNDEEALYALTNGAIWKYVSANRETYVCPEHVKKAKSVKVRWSYLMNAYFGWSQNGRPRAYGNNADRVSARDFSKAEKVLLFSEVPFMGYNAWQPEGEGATSDTDPILNYGKTSDLDGRASTYAGNAASAEEIGVNHVSGRNAYAHVVFADGHTEKLRVPMVGKKPDTSGFAELTTWLCAGFDVSFDGKGYSRVK